MKNGFLYEFIGEGWNEMLEDRSLSLEDRSLSQDLIRAQIGAYTRRGTTSSGRIGGPTWSQTRDITVEGLAPVVLKRLKRTAQPEGYDDLELRKVMRDSLYKGAMNFLRFKQPERPAGVTTDGADQLLDTPMR